MRPGPVPRCCCCTSQHPADGRFWARSAFCRVQPVWICELICLRHTHTHTHIDTHTAYNLNPERRVDQLPVVFSPIELAPSPRAHLPVVRRAFYYSQMTRCVCGWLGRGGKGGAEPVEPPEESSRGRGLPHLVRLFSNLYHTTYTCVLCCTVLCLIAADLSICRRLLCRYDVGL